MIDHPLWKGQTPEDVWWRPQPGLTRAERAAEQDAAAGGQHAREIVLPDGRRPLGSVYFRVLRGRRIYAYLRWSAGGKTDEQYIGEVDHHNRADNLAHAWRMAHEANLTTIDTPRRPSAAGVSWASSPATRAVMRANRGRDTRPEIALRSAVHALGLRYRVGIRPIKDVRRTADIVFVRARIAVFLDGCFWHGCPHHHRPAKGATAQFWRDKIDGNKRRDRETDQRLRDAGWQVIRIWEHEEPAEAARHVADLVAKRR